MDSGHTLKELVIELTDQCPQTCRHCSSCSSPVCSNHLSREVVHRILKEAVHLETKKVCFGGGEPTLSPLFAETLEIVSQTGMASEVFTCGLNLDSQDQPIMLRPEITEALAKAENTTAIFSVHGHNAELHDCLTQVTDSFEIMQTSIEACMNAGITCVANCVPTKLNYSCLREIVGFVESLGMRKLSLLRFVSQGRGETFSDELSLTHEEENEFVQDLLSLRHETKTELRTGSPFNGIVPDSFTPCRAAISKIVIQADGNTIPCEVFKASRRKDWGASVYSQSIEDILNSQSLSELREELIGSHCSVCPIHSKQEMARASGAS